MTDHALSHQDAIGPATPSASSAAAVPPPAAPNDSLNTPSHPQNSASPALADPEAKTLAQRLDAGEELWRWKVGLRVALIVVDIMAIGAAISITVMNAQGRFSLPDADSVPYTLVPVVLSAIWSLLWLLVLVLRKPQRAVHPGLPVAFDLLLWLALILTALATAWAAVQAKYYGDSFGNGEIDDPSTYPYGYRGMYTLQPNGTWVYKITYLNPYSAPTVQPWALVTTPVSVDATTTTLATATTATSTPTVLGRNRARYPAPTEAPSPTTASSPRVSSLYSGGDDDYDDDDDGNDEGDGYYSYAGDDSFPYGADPSTSYINWYADSTYSPVDYDPPSSTTRLSSAATITITDANLIVATTVRYSSSPTLTSFGVLLYTTDTQTYTAIVSRTCESSFASCRQQDAFVNKMWAARNRHYAIDVFLVVLQGLAVLLHFVLFVWACVDTNRYNRKRHTNNQLALNLLEDLRSGGYVLVPTAAAAAAAADTDTMAAQPRAFSVPMVSPGVPEKASAVTTTRHS